MQNFAAGFQNRQRYEQENNDAANGWCISTLRMQRREEGNH